MLECNGCTLAPLKRKFIRCSAQATITHLKKFIALKVLKGPQQYRDVSRTLIHIGNIDNSTWKFTNIGSYLFLI